MTGLGQELSGYTVVSVEQAVAAPYCGLLLADAGARVIKVERPGGDLARAYDRAAHGHSAYFAWLNRGKQSIVLDIDDDKDRALLDVMLAHADVLVHNLAPGALDRRGLAGAALRRTNPGLITCEITGYGRDGPYARMKAYDLLVQAESGLSAVTGTPETPARVGFSVCDIATGLTAFSAILRALLARGKSGEGCDISIAMFDVMADWMNVPLIYQRCRGQATPRAGLTHAIIAPYGVYRAGDGNEVLISIQSNREWKNFCETVLADPDLATDPRFAENEDRVANRAAMDAIINAVFSRHSRVALIALLNDNRIACASLNSVADLDRHPHLRNQKVEIGGAELLVADLPVLTGGER
ncbi:MAG TPA: CaiB/BaiF CoA-transferase family protein, partial [Afifellaceae bacterium]|nr:CaiB/BaiF CoA-transferase family protein [Afifellaceae bacterium]